MLDENYHNVNCMDSCCLQTMARLSALLGHSARKSGGSWLARGGRSCASIPSLSSSFVAVSYLNSFTSRIFFNGTKSTRVGAVVWEILT